MEVMERAGTRRRYHDDGVSDEETDGRRTFDLDEPLSSERFGSARIVRMAGTDFTYEYVQRGGLRDPVLFQRPDGLGLQMPEPDFSVNDVKMFVGSRRMMDVMDVSTQKATEMSMAQWTRYYETPPSQRDKLYNATSLEFSHTKLDRLVRRPATLDLLDWVDTMWPRHLKERQRDSSSSVPDMQYPKVQKYCLMSVEGCYTDFHVDFGGTSVWYHVLRGSKVFWLIPPTPQNLQLYEDWVLSGKQGDVFLGDRASDCQRMELQRGCTFIIPSGWIHAVYTPVDSLVFGGNFLHSFNVPTQLDVCSIEDRTRVPVKFRFPFYYEMCWYVLDRYVFSLTGTSYLTPEFQKLSLGIGESRVHTESTQKEEEEGDSDDDPPAGQIHLTPLELDGLWNLLGKLEVLPSNRKCVPAGIHNAAALVSHVKALLKEHANDVPKLSYTGKPVVRWPRRPSWYRPPPPPTPPPRPKLVPVPVPVPVPAPRPQKPASSMSVLRRRRVRCKRCEACVRPECGECNFCRDMKKFGGPGKLKQTCVLRQCLSPGLPLSAVCEICKEPNQEETGDPSLTLMECSNCAQIVHPACLTVPGDGVVNQDLPSCWECPKCVQGITDPEVECVCVCVLMVSLLQKRKSSSLLDARMAKIYRRQRHGRDGDDSASEDEDEGGRKMALHARGGGHASRRGFGASRRSLLRGGSAPRSARAGFGTPGSASVLKLKRGAGPRDGVRRGRGVRLRGGSRMQRRGDDSEDSDEDDEDEEDEDEEEEEDEEDEEEDSEDGEKERQQHRRRRRRRTDEDEDEDEDSEGRAFDPEEEDMDTLEDEDDEDDEAEDGRWDSDPEPPVLLVSDLNDELLSGSYLTVTLQRPQQARRTPGSIVPKLEAAMGPRGAAGGPGHDRGPEWNAPCPLSLVLVSRPCPCPPYLSPCPPSPLTSASGLRPRLRGNHGDRGSRPRSASSSEEDEAAAAALSPPSLLSTPSFRDVGNERGGEKEVWVSVFKFLNRNELLVCMTVCKAWYKWSCDKRLWSHVDVSRGGPLRNQALAGIVKRQPVSLDLSWTPVAKRQLNCLLTRLPGLRELRVSGLSWFCLSSMVSPSLPHLRLLDLRWCEGVGDAQIRDMVCPPGSESSRSRLRTVGTLRLSGLDVSDATLRLLQRHLPLLRRLDLSHCRNVSDASVALLAAAGSHTRHNLSELSLAGCGGLTDAVLPSLKRLHSLTLLDLRGCRGVSRRMCDAFISDLSQVALYCMMEEKLIQRLD
uniref:[histone H3]-dimethyl-L-lysine(36) demethylase n=1 Tax=Salarias fasciatus TaxID=181472 RepID=A0A672IC96_SALFA